MDQYSQSKSRRRAQQQHYSPSGAPLKLPTLPRFHPATFNNSSSSSSLSVTPSSQGTSPQPPMSPRTQQRQLSEAQRQLYTYQREMLAQASGTRSPYTTTAYSPAYSSGYTAAYTYGTSTSTKPVSPKLAPMADSPGPVTPLELEGDGYLAAGSGQHGSVDVEKLIRKEAQRQAHRHGQISPRRQAPCSPA